MSSGTPTERIYGNRYVIRDKIARGGMADVFLAQDRLLDRPVALKVLFPELSIDRSFVERFRREAQNAAKLSHPNIVSVYDWGEEDNVYYIVMEYIDGKSLSTIIRETGALGANRAALIGADVASALSFAHRNGVVHRDVKPGNVLIDTRGLVKVTDFGIARARNATESLTQTGAVMGTATYFSPEQAQGLAVDERSDVYSLGIVLYESVAGKAPFAGDNPIAIAYKHVRESAISLQEINPNIPADYEAIVAEAMAKAPANRYQNAEDLRADLVRFTHGQAVQATQVGPVAAATQMNPRIAPAATTAQPRIQPRAQYQAEKKSLAGPLLALASLLALIGIVALFFFTDNPFVRDSSKDTIAVPSVVNTNVVDAQRQLSELGLNSNVTRESNDAEVDTVLSQSPDATTEVSAGDTIDLTVSSGPELVTLSNYTGQSQAAATNALRALGLEVSLTQANSTQIEEGNVVSQDPAAGQELKVGDRVTLTISSGSQQVEVPDVINSTQSTAEQLLLDAQLRTRTVNVDSDQREGTVVSTDPAAGQQVNVGTTVTITVSNGPAPTTTTSSTTTTTSSGSNSTTTSTSRGSSRN